MHDSLSVSGLERNLTTDHDLPITGVLPKIAGALGTYLAKPVIVTPHSGRIVYTSLTRAEIKPMAKNITDAVIELCLTLPDSEQRRSHGSVDFRAAGKPFATYAVNHHGDGRLALWLRAAPGIQSMYVEGDPELFFVPPYVGPRGWLGVNLDAGSNWVQIAELIWAAYREATPAKLREQMPPVPHITAPTETIDPIDFDPFQAPSVQTRLREIEKICLALPEASRHTQFGNPCYKAGKKTFCSLYMQQAQLQLSVWVGADAQVTLTFDPRYRIPAYTGVNGWISLDMHAPLLPGEAENLILESYQHFALRRMLKALPAAVKTQ